MPFLHFSYENNLRYLYIYHLLNGIAISVVASFLFIDKLLLRMDINLDSFGFIKGICFSVPTILNFMLAPYLQGLNKDRQIIAWGYIVRVFFPLFLLPLPFMIRDKNILSILVSIVLFISITAAVLANNSSAVLWKKVIPPEIMGRHTGILTAACELPFCFAAVLFAWMLERYSSGSDTEFYLTFLVIQLGSGIFQIPAALMIMKISISPEKVSTNKNGFTFSHFMLPFRDSSYTPVLKQIFLQSLLSAQLSAYIFPYLLNQCGISMSAVSILEMFLAVIAFFLYFLWGRLNERFSRWNLLKICMLGNIASLLFLLSGAYAAILVSALLCWQAARGIFGVGIVVSGKMLSLEFCPQERPNLYMAAYNLAAGGGIFTGFITSSVIFSVLNSIFHDSPENCYTLFFATCLIPCCILYIYCDSNSKLEGAKLKNTTTLMECESVLYNTKI